MDLDILLETAVYQQHWIILTQSCGYKPSSPRAPGSAEKEKDRKRQEILGKREGRACHEEKEEIITTDFDYSDVWGRPGTFSL